MLCNRFHFINREVHIYCNWWTVMQEVGMSWCLLSLNVSALDTSMVNISRLFDFIQLFHCSKRGIIWIYSNRKNCWKLSVIINGEIYVNLFCAITRIMSDLGAFKFREDIGVILGKESCGCFPWNICSWWWIVNWCIFTPAGIMQTTGGAYWNEKVLPIRRYLFWIQPMRWLCHTTSCSNTFTVYINLLKGYYE